MPLVLIVNGCGRHLRNISIQIPLDHSAIQVVTRMIGDALKDAPAQVYSLVSSAKNLQDITSLSSGIGLVGMWSKWNCSDALTMAQTWSAQFDDLARSLDNPSIHSGR